MSRLAAIAIAFTLGQAPVLGGAAWAAPAAGTSELVGLREEVRKAEASLAPLFDKRRRLEAEAARLAAEIDAQKRKAAGVRRDLDLQPLLASSKTTTDELERVQGELRWREPGLAELRRRLVRAIDGVLGRGTLGEAERAELERLRAQTVAVSVVPAAPLQIVRDQNAAGIDPLDGPRELKHKADLLRDSGDKLRREARRIAGRIDDVERRRRLRERAGALDEDMFGETTSNRRVARAQGTAVAAANTATNRGGAAEEKANADAARDPSFNAPNAPATPGTGLNGPSAAPPSQTGNLGNQPAPTTPATPAPTNAGGGRTSESTVLRNLVDPATLDELRRADAVDDVDRQTRALKKAQGELEALASELDKKARALEGRADELKRKK